MLYTTQQQTVSWSWLVAMKKKPLVLKKKRRCLWDTSSCHHVSRVWETSCLEETSTSSATTGEGRSSSSGSPGHICPTHSRWTRSEVKLVITTLKNTLGKKNLLRLSCLKQSSSLKGKNGQASFRQKTSENTWVRSSLEPKGWLVKRRRCGWITELNFGFELLQSPKPCEVHHTVEWESCQ